MICCPAGDDLPEPPETQAFQPDDKRLIREYRVSHKRRPFSKIKNINDIRFFDLTIIIKLVE